MLLQTHKPCYCFKFKIRKFIFLTWIHQLWKFVLIATKDVIVGKVAKNASNYFVYFVMIISKLMLKLLMFSLS